MNRPLTKKNWRTPRFFADSGLPTNPETLHSVVWTPRGIISWSIFLPKTSAIRLWTLLAGRLNTSTPLLRRVKEISGYTSTIRWKAVMILFSSVVFDFRNFRRAGTLKKRFSTRKLLPTGHEHGSCPVTLLAEIDRWVPISSLA